MTPPTKPCGWCDTPTSNADGICTGCGGHPSNRQTIDWSAPWWPKR